MPLFQACAMIIRGQATQKAQVLLTNLLGVVGNSEVYRIHLSSLLSAYDVVMDNCPTLGGIRQILSTERQQDHETVQK